MATSTHSGTDFVWALLRIALGWILFWAFLDKVWGLGYATAPEQAWINGGSPTEGFLQFATSGPFADFYASLAGMAIIDWMFMLGLGLIGAALILGIGIRVAVATGTALFLMMWSASLPPEHNPLISEHIVYVIALWGILKSNNTQVLGLGSWWAKQSLVQRFSFLR